jgi:hypothetical protein
MKKFVRNHGKQKPVEFRKKESLIELKIGSGQNKVQFKVLKWLASGFFIFSLLYCSSLLALVWLPPYAESDMKSNMVADYSPWDFIEFEPVEPAMLEEIKKERGLPDEIAIDGMPRSTPAGTESSIAATKKKIESTWQPTSESTFSTPTVIQGTSTSNSLPTSVASPLQPTATPNPSEVAHPTKSHKPAKTPRAPNTSRPPKPSKSPKP